MNQNYLTQITTLFLFLCCLNVYSQTMAVTELGDTIYVYNNGTWSFDALEEMPEFNEMAYLSSEIILDTILTNYTFSEKAKKEVKNLNEQFIIKYDDTKWKRVPPLTLNDEAEFAFKFKDSDIWSIVISEETTIEPDKLYRIAKKTMEDASGAEAEVIKTEVRTVNGKQVIRGVLKSSFSGITFIFDSYYYSDDLGSVQFTTWTSDKIWERNEDKVLELLNGFIVE